jgi:hypothetical protein
MISSLRAMKTRTAKEETQGLPAMPYNHHKDADYFS